MHQSVGHHRALSLCAALILVARASAAPPPPASQPARPTRLDLLYLHARLLTCAGEVPDAARPVLAEAARQKTWAARPPVALLTAEQARSLVAAFAAAPGTTANAVAPVMLVPNRRVTAAPRPAAAPGPSRLEVSAVAAALDARGALPLTLHATAATTVPPAPPAHVEPATAAWSADVGVAAPVEQTLLVDLGPSSGGDSDDRRPHAYLLVRASAHPVERKDPAAAEQVAGDLYRVWDRVWPLVTQLSMLIEMRELAEARRQVEVLRDQIGPSLDAAEGTDFAKAAGAMAEQLHTTATAVRRLEPEGAGRAFRRFQAEGNALHGTLARLLAASGRRPTGPATRPVSR